MYPFCPPTSNSEILCIQGYSDDLYKQALAWVDDHKRVIFVSEEERISEDLRIKICPLESPLQWGALARKIAWSAVFKKMGVVGDARFKEELEKCHLAADLILSEASDWWVGAWRNAVKNRGPYRRGMELGGVFQGVPAVIVGAGPSLEKNGHLLKEFEKRALIFAGGSALNAIDVEPHFAASIDKEAPYRQFKMHPFSETPFCYQSRMNPDNLALVHGERLLFPDSSSDLINWLYEEETFDGGWTVGNFLTAVAQHLGCSPIIFVGMDLCYTQGKKYAKIDAEAGELVQVGDYLTQRDWLMAAKWTEEREGNLINATEGGMLNLPRETLAEVLKKYSKEWDLRKWVHEAIQKLPVRDPAQKPLEWEDEVVEQKLLSPLWQIWKPIFEREVEIDPQQKLELHKTLFFQQVLEEYGSVILSER